MKATYKRLILDTTGLPVVTDDITKGYVIGDEWTYNDITYICKDNTTDAAVWEKNSNVSEITITKTGDFPIPMIPIPTLPAQGYYFNNVYYPPTGKCVGQMSLNGLNIPSTLTSLEFDFTHSYSAISIYGYPLLNTIRFDMLELCTGGFTIGVASLLKLPALTVFSALKLKICGTIAFQYCDILPTIDFPELECVTANIQPMSCINILSMNFPKLKYLLGSFNPNALTALTTINLSLLETIVGNINLSTLTALTTFELLSIIHIGNGISLISITPNITTFTLGANLKFIGGNIVITSAALNVASVNGLLASFVALDGTNGTTLYGSGRTITITGTSAAPTGQGLIDKATLVARGATVTTN